MSVVQHQVRKGRYYDSVVLMQLQRRLATSPGIEEAGVVMATPANLELLAEAALLDGETADFRPDDLVIALRAKTSAVAEEVLGSVDELLRGNRTEVATDYRPKSLRGGLQQAPNAPWVLISVPGTYAAKVAHQALAADRSVFLYSDNVSLEDEVELKREAEERGLLVLGPDCGTTILGGVGLGFANRVDLGPVGLVGASGTGLQMVSTRLLALGTGTRHAIGTGGRDLSDEVAGSSTLRVVKLLGADPEVQVIVVVSKPPSPGVTARLLNVARGVDKPVVLYLQGSAPPARQVDNLHFAWSLEDASQLAHDLVGKGSSRRDEVSHGVSDSRTGGALRGLFSGGTLATEMVLRLAPFLDLATNVHVPLEVGVMANGKHEIVDLGADEFTVGRPHPMMDPTAVVEALSDAAQDESVSTLLLDVVLGDGAHADPAAVLAPALESALRSPSRHERQAGVVLVGTPLDPQDLAEQRQRLEASGARVFASVDGAAHWALGRLGVGEEGTLRGDRGGPLLDRPSTLINVGVELFYDALLDQEVAAVQVDWRPPAGGDLRLVAILEELDKVGSAA